MKTQERWEIRDSQGSPAVENKLGSSEAGGCRAAGSGEGGGDGAGGRDEGGGDEAGRPGGRE